MVDRCNRYVFRYSSPVLEIKDYILRLADLAEETYGRDIYFARFNQVLDNARILGWKIPRFGDSIPEPFQDLSPEGIDHIFENQAKILVDISPVSVVTLENGEQFPIRMIGGTTPAGDLNWKLHLLIDKKGQPYIQHNAKLLVKTRGTKVICSSETFPYDELSLRDYFGGNRGIWPVPFLPEFFSDHPVAQVFMAEGVTEIVKIEEKEPVHVLATVRVPWYRILEIDTAKALPMSGYQQPLQFSESLPESDLEETVSSEEIGTDSNEEVETDSSEEIEEEFEKVFPKNNYIEVEPIREEPKTSFTNVQVILTESEAKKLSLLEETISNSGIHSKQEAERLRQDPNQQKQAEQWLLAAVNRLTLLANASARIGAALSLIEKNLGQPIIIIQPREKWAVKLDEVLQQRGINSRLVSSSKKLDVLLRKLNSGKIQALIAFNFQPELFSVENSVIILTSCFSPNNWFENLQINQQVYSISIKQLGLGDHNYVIEHPLLTITTQDYQGPSFSLFKNSEIPMPKVSKGSKKKESKNFKIETGRGKPLKASTLEEATEIAKKKETEGCRCQILDPTGQVVYLTNVGNVEDKIFEKEKVK